MELHEPPALRRIRRRYGWRRWVNGFLTGLAVLGPVLLTVIVLAWLFGQLIGILGPDSLLGQGLTALGGVFTGRGSNPLLGFLIGVLLLAGAITALGLFVRDRAADVFEDWVDGAIGRIPVLGGVYRPVAQLVRGMSGHKSEAMASMGVCRVIFGGGIETIAFLASPHIFDVGGGPARLVLIPTAPVPVGGALLLVACDKVEHIPDMKFEDLAKLYLTMGMTPPAWLKGAPPG
jgi:uncharacterized membrane protein